MQVVLRRYGNSTVAVLPPAVLKDLGLAAGQAMTLGTTARGEIVLAPRKKYVLADLMLTPREFNRLGDVLVAPITQGAQDRADT